VTCCASVCLNTVSYHTCREKTPATCPCDTAVHWRDGMIPVPQASVLYLYYPPEQPQKKVSKCAGYSTVPAAVLWYHTSTVQTAYCTVLAPVPVRKVILPLRKSLTIRELEIRWVCAVSIDRYFTGAQVLRRRRRSADWGFFYIYSYCTSYT